MEERKWRRRSSGEELEEEEEWRRACSASARSLSDKASDEETIDILPVLPVRVRQ